MFSIFAEPAIILLKRFAAKTMAYNIFFTIKYF